jgi:hypothetical protein
LHLTFPHLAAEPLKPTFIAPIHSDWRRLTPIQSDFQEPPALLSELDSLGFARVRLGRGELSFCVILQPTIFIFQSRNQA